VEDKLENGWKKVTSLVLQNLLKKKQHPKIWKALLTLG
jgi:hypothetical protein